MCHQLPPFWVTVPAPGGGRIDRIVEPDARNRLAPARACEKASFPLGLVVGTCRAGAACVEDSLPPRTGNPWARLSSGPPCREAAYRNRDRRIFPVRRGRSHCII